MSETGPAKRNTRSSFWWSETPDPKGKALEESALTHEAKAAIRSYMLRIVAIPGVVLTVTSFTLGFLVNDVAREGAYNQAYTAASSKILELTAQASSASASAENSRKQVERLLHEADRLVTEADAIRARLRTTQLFDHSDQLVGEVAASLSHDRAFTSSLVEAFQHRLGGQEGQAAKSDGEAPSSGRQ